MKKLISLLSLLAGLILPIVLMIILRSPSYSQSLLIALGAIVAGWICNVIWASTTILEIGDGGPAETRKIALKFGWICPSVLALVTFIVQLFFR